MSDGLGSCCATSPVHIREGSLDLTRAVLSTHVNTREA